MLLFSDRSMKGGTSWISRDGGISEREEVDLETGVGGVRPPTPPALHSVLGLLDQLLYLLTVMSDRIARTFKRSGANRTVALDISKAFDRVWHAELLHKLKSYRIY